MDPVELGTRGPATGVSPVPPSIKESKLKIPVDGVWMGIPGRSLLRTPAKVCEGVNVNGTANELGRFGFIISPIGRSNVGVRFEADDMSGLLCSSRLLLVLWLWFSPVLAAEDEHVEDVESLLFIAIGGVGAS